MKSTILIFSFAALLGSTLGCSTTVRHMTAGKWIAPPGDESAKVASPETRDGDEAVGVGSRYYLAYWEGTCRKILYSQSCSDGSASLKRCTVAPDNTATCTEEEHVSKILNGD